LEKKELLFYDKRHSRCFSSCDCLKTFFLQLLCSSSPTFAYIFMRYFGLVLSQKLSCGCSVGLSRSKTFDRFITSFLIQKCDSFLSLCVYLIDNLTFQIVLCVQMVLLSALCCLCFISPQEIRKGKYFPLMFIVGKTIKDSNFNILLKSVSLKHIWGIKAQM
jgi:hypothetical protein